MPDEKQKPSGKVMTWKEFAQRHKGNPLLNSMPLYSLPEELIDAIVDEAPDLFKEENETFERDLAKLNRGDPRLEERHAVSDRQIREMRAEEMKRGGANSLQVKNLVEAENERKSAVIERREAYTAWLVTNPQFREERDALRNEWGDQVTTWGRFPSLVRSFLGESTQSLDLIPEEVVRKRGWSEQRWHKERAKVNAPFEAFEQFYRRWCLERFQDWDLPEPMWPDLFGFTTHETFTMSEAGVNFFLPWYTLKDQKFTLEQLAGHLKRLSNPDHLQDWLSRERGWGIVRYRQLYVLYRHWHLTLQDRYSDRLEGHTEALDRAFARYLKLGRSPNTGAESVKKIRIFLNKNL